MKIDYSRDRLLSPFGEATMRDRYMIPGETSPQDAFARAAKAFADDDDHAQRIYDYASKMWFMFSTPILTNGGTKRGLPISCFLNTVGDSRKSLADYYTENIFLSTMGGGIGSYFGDLRSVGTKTSNGSESTGVVPFIKVVDSQMLAFSQGGTRRGSAAVYLDINHPEIKEFLDIRKPTGDANRASVNIHHGVIITDEFMQLIKNATETEGFDDSFNLVDPHTGKVTETVSAKTLWIKIIQNRVQTGEPYIMFKDAVDRAQPIWQKNLGLEVKHSNLCTEILLAANEERTAVCCLSSVNAEEFDNWGKDPMFIPDLVRFLDNVLEHFIQNAPDELQKAKYSAYRERSIGIGLMGFHAYLQRHHIAFESPFAKKVNIQLYEHLKREALRADAILCAERGECPDAVGYGRRFSHLLAPAPNASSSIICSNTSPANEPYTANAFTQKTGSGSSLLKNEYLQHILQEIGMDTEDVWKSIVTNGGSVQHLDFLDEHTKNVFKTFEEIEQKHVVIMAADRQKYICQSQSINLTYPADVSKQELHRDHMLAWSLGMKTLYYLRSRTAKRADNVSAKVTREIIFEEPDCVACEG